MSGDACKTYKVLNFDVQENGIVRDAESGQIVGRLDDLKRSLDRPTYTAVLTRGIPVEYPMTDTCVKVCKPGDTIDAIMKWAEETASGAAWVIKVEIVEAD